MDYISTRGNYRIVKSASAIKTGMVPVGGLFVPDSIPQINIQKLKDLNYQDLAYEILNLYLTDFANSELKSYINKAYNSKHFNNTDIVPLHFINDTTAILELWHGPTAAFKDLALQIMPYFLTSAAKKAQSNKEIVILVATSGDTGKAALEGFKNVEGTRIIVFYPKDGVSDIQKRQMDTTDGNNTYVVAVDGNFDDCQTMVKNIFADAEFNKTLNNAGFELSSANSINWGRLVPQIIYYFYSYFQIAKAGKINIGDPINFSVPTGNFGNILAGYYAYQMGLPVKQFICASNINKVLTDFINTGVYDSKREFYRTSSPSMDILISSNLERFLFSINGNNPEKIQRWYNDLQLSGKFKIDNSTLKNIRKIFTAGFASEKEVSIIINRAFKNHHYLVDTHTAVAMNVTLKYREETGDNTLTIIASTASPFKFNKTVYSAITGDDSISDEFALLDKLSNISGVKIHRAVKGLDKLEIHHKSKTSISESRKVVKTILGV